MKFSAKSEGEIVIDHFDQRAISVAVCDTSSEEDPDFAGPPSLHVPEVRTFFKVRLPSMYTNYKTTDLVLNL